MRATIKLIFDNQSDYFDYLSMQNAGNGTVIDAIKRLEDMSGSISDALTRMRENVQRLETVKDSVDAFAKGVPDLIRRAVDDAVAKGATAEQMAEMSALADRVGAISEEIAGDVVMNTPQAGEAPATDTVPPAPDAAPVPAEATPAEPAPDAPVPSPADAGVDLPPPVDASASGTVDAGTTPAPDAGNASGVVPTTTTRGGV